jgi:hypothetical protein
LPGAKEARSTRGAGSSSTPRGPKAITTKPAAKHPEVKTDEAHIARLLLTFNEASFEYSNLPDTDAHRKRNAAKFLRDSAENALAYLRTSKPDHYMLPTLKRTFEMAQAKCVWLNGGRKRPFEMNDAEYEQRAKRAMDYQMGVARGADCYRPTGSGRPN